MIDQGCLRLLPDGNFDPGGLESSGDFYFVVIFRVFSPKSIA